MKHNYSNLTQLLCRVGTSLCIISLIFPISISPSPDPPGVYNIHVYILFCLVRKTCALITVVNGFISTCLAFTESLPWEIETLCQIIIYAHIPVVITNRPSLCPLIKQF